MKLAPHEIGMSYMSVYQDRKKRLDEVKEYINKAQAANRETFVLYTTFFFKEFDNGTNKSDHGFDRGLGEVLTDLTKSNDTFFNAVIGWMEREVKEAAAAARKEALAIIEETGSA